MSLSTRPSPPTVKHTGQELGGELSKIFKFGSFLRSANWFIFWGLCPKPRPPTSTLALDLTGRVSPPRPPELYPPKWNFLPLLLLTTDFLQFFSFYSFVGFVLFLFCLFVNWHASRIVNVGIVALDVVLYLSMQFCAFWDYVNISVRQLTVYAFNIHFICFSVVVYLGGGAFTDGPSHVTP